MMMCPVTDISATVPPISVKFCTMVHIGPGHKVTPKGASKSQILTANNLENGKSQRYKNQIDDSFLKSIA